MSAPDSILRTPIGDFLDAVADGSPAVASGAGAIVATAVAAGLVSMCARRSSGGWDEASAAVGQAERLRSRAIEMLGEAVIAHEQAVERLGRADGAGDASEQRDWQLGVALRRAAKVPALCAGVAADVAELGAEAFMHCEPGCRPDALAACRFAEVAAQTSAELVEANLAIAADDQLRVDAAASVVCARAARERASTGK